MWIFSRYRSAYYCAPLRGSPITVFPLKTYKISITIRFVGSSKSTKNPYNNVFFWCVCVESVKPQYDNNCIATYILWRHTANIMIAFFSGKTLSRTENTGTLVVKTVEIYFLSFNGPSTLAWHGVLVCIVEQTVSMPSLHIIHTHTRRAG